MAVTATLVAQTPNHLRYLITSDASGGTATITSTGAATPDLQTDSLGGPIKNLANTFVAGFGTIAAGTNLSVGQAQALWLSDDSTAISSSTNALGAVISKLPTAICVLTPRTGVTPDWEVNCTAPAGSAGAITVNRTAAAVGTAYLDVEVPNAIG